MVETTVIDEVVTEDGVVIATETVVDEIAVDDETGELVVTETVTDEVELAEVTSEPVEVDLRDASHERVGARSGSEVPVAAAPEEGTANRAVLIAGPERRRARRPGAGDPAAPPSPHRLIRPDPHRSAPCRHRELESARPGADVTGTLVVPCRSRDRLCGRGPSERHVTTRLRLI